MNIHDDRTRKPTQDTNGSEMRTRLGCTRMRVAAGYVRDFAPDFLLAVKAAAPATRLILEKSYGKDLGFLPEQYDAIGDVQWCEREKVFREADVLLQLTAPSSEDIALMWSHQVLVSMLHFDEDPERNQLLDERGVIAISIDALKDAEGERLVQDFGDCQ
jgi:hypothetical protein